MADGQLSAPPVRADPARIALRVGIIYFTARLVTTGLLVLATVLAGPGSRIGANASLADNVDAEVEYAIAMFNGTGTPKNQPAAVALLRKASRQGSAIAQNRLAWVLINGVGVPADKVEGFKWHLVAKTAGKGDPELDKQLADLPAEERAKAEAAAKKWLGSK